MSWRVIFQISHMYIQYSPYQLLGKKHCHLWKPGKSQPFISFAFPPRASKWTFLFWMKWNVCLHFTLNKCFQISILARKTKNEVPFGLTLTYFLSLFFRFGTLAEKNNYSHSLSHTFSRQCLRCFLSTLCKHFIGCHFAAASRTRDCSSSKWTASMTFLTDANVLHCWQILTMRVDLTIAFCCIGISPEKSPPTHQMEHSVLSS